MLFPSFCQRIKVYSCSSITCSSLFSFNNTFEFSLFSPPPATHYITLPSSLENSDTRVLIYSLWDNVQLMVNNAGGSGIKYSSYQSKESELCNRLRFVLAPAWNFFSSVWKKRKQKHIQGCARLCKRRSREWNMVKVKTSNRGVARFFTFRGWTGAPSSTRWPQVWVNTWIVI